MPKCNICYAWEPHEWDGVSRFTDTVAYCKVHGKTMPSDWTCPSASIAPPKQGINNVQSVSSVKQASKSTKTISPFINSGSVDPETGNIALYAHQQDAFEFFKDQKAIGLFLTVGLGKSAIALRLCGYKFRKGEIDSILIVAPNQLHRQWYKQQLPLWLDAPYNAQCLFGNGGAKEAYPFDPDPDFMQVVCVNIDTFSTPKKWKDIADWANSRKTCIILDEATVIKNHKAARTQRLLYEFNDVIYKTKTKTILKSIPKSPCRMVLTGTPVTNGPMDLWSICEFLQPNFFGRNYYSFQNHFGMFTKMAVGDREISIPLSPDMWASIKRCQTYAEAYSFTTCTEDTFNTIHSQDHFEGPYKHADELKEALKPIAFFKKIEDCFDMPAQVYNTKNIQMSPEQRQCYNDMIEQYITTYAEHTATALNKMTAVIRLQQISSGFICDKEFQTDEDAVNTLYGLNDEDDITPDDGIQWIGTSNPKLDALYRDVDEAEKPMLIITRFSAEAARIYADLSTKYRCCLMTGWKRVGTIEAFQNNEYDIMVANIAVVARGFNLQNSYILAFYSNSFSLEHRLQAEGRIFRIGQTHPCEYLDYINEDSIDEKVVTALKLKRNLLEYIRTEDIKEVVAC